MMVKKIIINCSTGEKSEEFYEQEIMQPLVIKSEISVLKEALIKKGVLTQADLDKEI